MYTYIHIHISYRKLAWVGFEFRSDALTDWAIWPWVQLALRANFVQLLQFHVLFSVHVPFLQLRLSFGTFALSEILCWESHYKGNELIHMVFTTKGFWEVAIEIWPEWDVKPWPHNSIQTLQPTELSGPEFKLHSEPNLYYYNFVQCSRFILVIALISHHVYFKWNLAQVITLVAEWIDTYGIQCVKSNVCQNNVWKMSK